MLRRWVYFDPWRGSSKSSGARHALRAERSPRLAARRGSTVPANGPAQHHLPQARSVQASRYGSSWLQGLGGVSQGEGRVFNFVPMGSGSRRRSIIAPRPCSRRLDAHGAEPRASGGPTARGMARVTSPHGVKPDEPARGHGVTVYGLPCACPCGAGTFPGSFPGLSVGRPCGSPCGVPWAVPAGAAACAVASRTYRGRKGRECDTLSEKFFPALKNAAPVE